MGKDVIARYEAEKEMGMEKLREKIAETVPHFKLDIFSEIIEIGDGGEGRVYRANSDQFGFVALKVFKRKILLKGHSREIELLAKVRHPHVVQLFGIILDESNIRTGFLMEYMKTGSLHKIIHDLAFDYKMKQIYSWINQASLGVQYLHKHNLLHRDIKPQNMLLGYSIDHLKLADFGLTRERTANSNTGGVGTLLYMAPEVIETTSYAVPADVYSLTVSIWEMIHRRRPFYEENDAFDVKIVADVRNGRRPLVDRRIVDTEMERVLQKGWHANPSERISVTNLIALSKLKLTPNQSAEKAPTDCGATANSSTPLPEKSTLIISNLSEENMIKNEKKRTSRSLLGAGILLILVAFAIGVWITITKIQDGREETKDKVSNTGKESDEAPDKMPLQVLLKPPRVKRETILLMGGRNNEDTDEMLVLDRKSSQWKTLRLKLPRAAVYASAFYLGGAIYVFGGVGWKKMLYKLDTKQMEWIELAEMNENHDSTASSSIVYQDCIWVFIGWDGEKTIWNGEKYCPATNTWTKIHDLIGLGMYAVTAVHNGSIVISIGRRRVSVLMKTTHQLDPSFSLAEWPSMPAPRIYHSMISFGDHLIVMGGFETSFKAFNTVWCLNPEETNATWKELPPMKEARLAHSAVVVDSEIFVIGGQNENEATQTVEIFDGKTWRYGPDLPTARWGTSAVVIPSELADSLVNYRQYNETILLMDGFKNEMLILDWKSFRWEMLSLKMPAIGGYASSAYLNGEIYIFGGFSFPKKLYKFDHVQMSWIQMVELNEERTRTRSSTVVFDGCVWAFGGGRTQQVLNSVEKYCPEIDKWIQVDNQMNTGRRSAAAAIHKGHVIISGGGGPAEGNPLKSVESFDPISGNWTTLVDMPARRTQHSMVSFRGSLVVVGGFEDRVVAFDTVWSLNPAEKNAAWKKLPPMKVSRQAHSVVVLNDEIFAIGGINDDGHESVEIFDGKNWRYGPELPSARWGTSAVLIPVQLAEILIKTRVKEHEAESTEQQGKSQEKVSKQPTY